MATMALVTVAGETLGPERKTWVAKDASVSGWKVEMFSFLTNDWNFFQPDWYWRQVDVLWALIKSSMVAWGISSFVSARVRKPMRSSVRTSSAERLVLAGWHPVGGVAGLG